MVNKAIIVRVYGEKPLCQWQVVEGSEEALFKSRKTRRAVIKYLQTMIRCQISQLELADMPPSHLPRDLITRLLRTTGPHTTIKQHQVELVVDQYTGKLQVSLV